MDPHSRPWKTKVFKLFLVMGGLFISKQNFGLGKEFFISII
jgi:hypothetical protein